MKGAQCRMGQNSRLEVRWLVHTPHGPVLVSVQWRAGEYLATLIAPPPTLAQVGHLTRPTVEAALAAMAEAVGGTAVVPVSRPAGKRA
jgi:hypothetical protein